MLARSLVALVPHEMNDANWPCPDFADLDNRHVSRGIGLRRQELRVAMLGGIHVAGAPPQVGGIARLGCCRLIVGPGFGRETVEGPRTPTGFPHKWDEYGRVAERGVQLTQMGLDW